MPAATTAGKLMRAEVLVELLAQIAGQPGMERWRLFSGWPGQDMPREALWVYDVTGVVSFPLAMAGPKIYDDQFMVTLKMLSRSGGTDQQTVLLTCQEAMNATVEVLRSDAVLGDRVAGVVKVLPGDIHGPYVAPNTAGDPGWEAHAEIEIACWIRVQ